MRPQSLLFPRMANGGWPVSGLRDMQSPPENNHRVSTLQMEHERLPCLPPDPGIMEMGLNGWSA